MSRAPSESQRKPQCVVDGTCGRDRRPVDCEVDRVASAVSVPDSVAAEARNICASVVKGRLAKRKPLALMAASSVYAACRESLAPVTLKELASASRSSTSEIGKCYKSIVDGMRITPPAPNGIAYAAKVALRLGSPENVVKLSEGLVRKAVENGLGDRNPMTLAASALYVASLAEGENVRQSDVAEAAGVSVLSVRECIRLLRGFTEKGPPRDDSAIAGPRAAGSGV